MQGKLIKEYAQIYGFHFDLPNIRLCIYEGVYAPKLDSFLLAKHLMEIVEPNHKVLDIGTGAGILAILAAFKGASVVATDIHEPSVRCAEYNASLNGLSIGTRVGNLFDPILKSEVFDLIVSNTTSLPSPPNETHDDYTMRNINGGPDGRKYLDPLIQQAPSHLRKGGTLLIQHSNFSNIDQTKEMLEIAEFDVTLEVYDSPIGKTSGQRIDYFISKLPPNCHPFQKDGKWHQEIGVFTADLRSSGPKRE